MAEVTDIQEAIDNIAIVTLPAMPGYHITNAKRIWAVGEFYSDGNYSPGKAAAQAADVAEVNLRRQAVCGEYNAVVDFSIATTFCGNTAVVTVSGTAVRLVPVWTAARDSDRESDC